MWRLLGLALSAAAIAVLLLSVARAKRDPSLRSG